MKNQKSEIIELRRKNGELSRRLDVLQAGYKEMVAGAEKMSSHINELLAELATYDSRLQTLLKSCDEPAA